MKKFLAILMSVVLLLASFALCASAEDAVADPVLKFKEDGSFRIMQISDTHYTDQYNVIRPLGITLINTMLDKYNPDLVVFTGDNIKGYFDLATPRTVIEAIDQLVSPVANRNIPFAVVFGNHDYQSMVPEKQQMVFYNQYPTCLAENGYGYMTRHGNYNLTIKDSAGTKDIFNLWFADSGTKDINDDDAGIKEAQIKWYQKTSDALAANNGGNPLPSLWFQHIPVRETLKLMTEVSAETEGAKKDSNTGKYYVLNEGVEGTLHTIPSYGVKDAGIYDAWVAQGDVIGAFFGHDHTNDYQGTTEDGILLAATKTAGFWSRNEGENSGVRIIDLNENDLTKVETKSALFNEVYDGDINYSKADYDTEERVKDFFYHILLEIRMIVKSFKYYVSFLF